MMARYQAMLRHAFGLTANPGGRQPGRPRPE
jgi:hypothetical protein